MNRALKRALKHKKFVPEKVVPLPRAIDEFVIFDIPQRLLDELKADRLSIDEEGTPVFQDNHGIWQETVPALRGWIITWQSILGKLTPAAPQATLPALEQLCKHLDDDTEIESSVVGEALGELNFCRHVFRTGDIDEIRSIARTSQIAILIEKE